MMYPLAVSVSVCFDPDGNATPRNEDHGEDSIPSASIGERSERGTSVRVDLVQVEQ